MSTFQQSLGMRNKEAPILVSPLPRVTENTNGNTEILEGQ